MTVVRVGIWRVTWVCTVSRVWTASPLLGLLGLVNILLYMSKKRPTQTTQSTISSFFSQGSNAASARTTSGSKSFTKRGSTPIDLTIDSDDGEHPPPAKRQKTTTIASPFFTPRKNVPPSLKAAQPSRNGGHAEQWRFDPSSPTRATQPIANEKQRSAHERAKRILLGGDGVFSQAARSRGTTPGTDGLEGLPEDEREQSADEGDDTEKKFGELMEMFSSSSSRAKKRRTTGRKATAAPAAGPSRSRAQRVEEVGPSGQTYTPFELQVRVYSRVMSSPHVHNFRCESSRRSIPALSS